MQKLISERVRFSVSPERRKFREAQTRINRTLWSTEICYGHVLATAPKFCENLLDSGVWEVFNHADTAAWYPNRQGEKKYKSSVQQFLVDVKDNVSTIHRALMLQFYASFETYFRNRVRAIPARKEKRVAPFVLALSDDLFTKCACPLRVGSVIDGDICRMARNAVAHNDELPSDHMSPIVRKWRSSLEAHSLALKAWNADSREIDRRLRKITFEIDRQVKTGSAKGKKLSHDFFFALFSFTMLDQLASEIEEALMETSDMENWIWRSSASVRRKDLILIGDPQEKAAAVSMEESLPTDDGQNGESETSKI